MISQLKPRGKVDPGNIDRLVDGLRALCKVHAPIRKKYKRKLRRRTALITVHQGLGFASAELLARLLLASVSRLESDLNKAAEGLRSRYGADVRIRALVADFKDLDLANTLTNVFVEAALKKYAQIVTLTLWRQYETKLAGLPACGSMAFQLMDL